MPSWIKKPVARAAVWAAILVIPAQCFNLYDLKHVWDRPVRPHSQTYVVASDVSMAILMPGTIANIFPYGHDWNPHSWSIPIISWLVYFAIFYYGFHSWERHSRRQQQRAAAAQGT
ncbi:MAG: hypothetical protein WAM91_13265 [Candidatus Acidiferrales bacterium]